MKMMKTRKTNPPFHFNHQFLCFNSFLYFSCAVLPALHHALHYLLHVTLHAASPPTFLLKEEKEEETTLHAASLSTFLPFLLATSHHDKHCNELHAMKSKTI